MAKNITNCKKCGHRYNTKEGRHVNSGEIRPSVNDFSPVTMGCTIRDKDQIQEFKDEGFFIVCSCPDERGGGIDV